MYIYMLFKINIIHSCIYTHYIKTQIYVYIYIYQDNIVHITYTYSIVNIYIYIYVHIHTYVSIYIYVCVCVCMCMYLLSVYKNDGSKGLHVMENSATTFQITAAAHKL